MAPRLSRWIALTIVAAGIVATALLTTGGTPLIFAWGGIRQTEGEMTTAQRRIGMARYELMKVRMQRAELEERAQLAAILARTDADPLVLKWEGARLVIDAPATAALGPVWAPLPTRRSDIRTIVIQNRGDPTAEWVGTVRADLRADGTCLIHPRSVRAPKSLALDMREGGGECLLAEQFGVPGKGVRQWLDGVRSGLTWDRSPRRYWSPVENDGVVMASGAWFDGDGGGSLFWRSEYVWRQVNRLETACIVGRVEECEAAAGVGASGWPEVEQRRLGGLYLNQFPSPSMPRDLLLAVGPENFAEIWSSDGTIAASYARVTGKPMSEWVMQWGRRFTGLLIRDNGLSLAGWLGALIWITLLAALTARRLKQRAVT